MTATAVIAGIVFLLAYMGLIASWQWFAEFAIRREAGRTFVEAYVPTTDDVLAAEQAIADAERVVIAEDICNALDEAQAIVDGWSK